MDIYDNPDNMYDKTDYDKAAQYMKKVTLESEFSLIFL